MLINYHFDDSVFDGVWITAVLEHVIEPQKVVDEIWRVLKPAGMVYAETPFMQQVHERAYDFTRFTANGQRWLFRRFEQIDAGVVGARDPPWRGRSVTSCAPFSAAGSHS